MRNYGDGLVGMGDYLVFCGKWEIDNMKVVVRCTTFNFVFGLCIVAFCLYLIGLYLCLQISETR